MIALIAVIALAGVAWMTQRQPEPAPQPEPGPGPKPPTTTPPGSPGDVEPEPQPQPMPEPKAQPLYALGETVNARDGRAGPVTETQWDPHLKTWLYRIGSWASWYQQANLLVGTPPTPEEWPLNNTGQRMVRALTPAGEKILITPAEASGKVDAPGWRLFGEVAPEPSAADLRELVRLEAVRNRDDFRETMARMGITDQDLAQWPEGRAELGIHDVPNIIAAKRLGWDSSKMSFEAWGGHSRLPQTTAERRAKGFITHDDVRARLRRVGEEGTDALKRQNAIANRYSKSKDWLLALAARRGITP